MADALALQHWQDNNLVSTQNKLASFISELQAKIAISGGQGGLPEFYIDPTAIAECVPYCDSTDDIPEHQLNAAHVKIEQESMVDGQGGYVMPTVGGVPIWDRLDGEKIDYYKIFKEYREMKYTAITTSAGAYNGHSGLSQRSIGRLSEQLNTPGRLLTILSKIYHWGLRVRAYDNYKTVEHQLVRERNAELLELKHAKFSNSLLEQAFDYLKTHEDKLDPKVAMDMINIGMKYGRISAGLPGDRPTCEARTGNNKSGYGNGTSFQGSDGYIANQINVVGNIQSGENIVNSTNQSGPKNNIEQQFSSGLKNNGTVASILHVLNRSGAFRDNVVDPSEGLEDDAIDVTDDQ